MANLLANHSHSEATIAVSSFAFDPATVTGGSVTVATGVVTYTAGAGAGTASFEYTVATTAGGISTPAVVGLTILSNTDMRPWPMPGSVPGRGAGTSRGQPRRPSLEIW